MNKKKESLVKRLEVNYFPGDATHYIEYEYYKYAAKPHNKKVLVWRCGEWNLTDRTGLDSGCKIDSNKRKKREIENDLERVKRLLGKQSIDQLAEYYEISVYRFRQILDINKIPLPGHRQKKESLTIFG